MGRTFRRLPDGPIQRYVKQNADAYFDSPFGRPDERMALLNVRLSEAHAAARADRLDRLARDISEQHVDDARRPAALRHNMSLLPLVRPWTAALLQGLERRPPSPSTTRKVRRRR